MKRSNEHKVVLFDPIRSINSGQVFLWKNVNGSWYGINGKEVLKFTVIKKPTVNNKKIIATNEVEYQSFPKNELWENFFFRLNDDHEEVYKALSKDEIIYKIYQKYNGLRILRQDPFQCIITFVCASNTNVKRIRHMLTNISKKFGRKIIFDGLEFYLFPNAKELSNASINELTSCGLGYRAKFVKSVATEIESKMLNFEEIKRKHYFESRKELVKLKGIGNKTADCILLFAFEKLDAFPIDVWIYRSLLENYYWLFEDIKKYHSNNKPTNNQYNFIGSRVREYFGENAGYVQQYLYYHVRDTSRRTW